MNLSRILEALRSGANPDEAQWAFKGSQKSKSTSKSTPYQQPEYRRLLDESTSWLNAQQASDQSYGVDDPVADLTPEQLQAISQQGASGQALNDLYGTTGMGALSSVLGEYDPSTTGLEAAIDAANRRAEFNYQTTVAPSIRQGAMGAGQYGSSRSGIAEGIARAQLSQQQTDAASTLAFQDQQAFQNRRLQALGNLSGITQGLTSGSTALYNAGALTQAQQQAEIAGELDKWAYENNIDANTLAQYKALITGDMGGTTKTTTTQSGGGGFGSALGSIGGMAFGSYLGGMTGGLGTGIGASIGRQIGGSVGGGSSAQFGLGSTLINPNSLTY